MLSFLGTIFGCFVFTMIMMLLLKRWDGGTAKLLLVSAFSWVVLSVGDNVTRGTETLPDTFIRIGFAQIITLLGIMAASLFSKSKDRRPAAPLDE
jgi:hypothetical protein